MIENGPMLIAFLAYFVLMLGIGVATARRSSFDITEFFVGGRNVNRFVVALSAVVSGRSAWVFLALSGLAYAIGVGAIWYVAGFILVEMILFFTFAKRIRNFAEQNDCITVPDLFAARFPSVSRTIRVTVVLVMMIFLLPYIASQFMGGGLSLATTFSIETGTAIAITAGVVLVYTILGGFMAVSITDTLQAGFMLFALVVLPWSAVIQLGGWDSVLSALRPEHLDPFAIGAGAIIGGLGLGLGSAGNAHIVQRYIAIDDVKGLNTAGIVGTIWNTLMCLGAIQTGVVARAFFPGLGNTERETVFPLMVESTVHPVLGGVLLAAVFAAIMSTADSQLLVAASAVVRDLVQKLTRAGQDLSDRALVLLSRAVVGILVAAAITIGLTIPHFLHDLIILAWSGPGAALGPTLLLAMFWKRTTGKGVLSGIICGVLMVLGWYWVSTHPDLPNLKQEITDEIIPGVLTSFFVCVGVSLLSEPEGDKASETANTPLATAGVQEQSPEIR